MDTEHFRDRLNEEKERVEGLIGEIGPRLRAEDQTESVDGLADYDQHPADKGTETFERTKDMSILESLERELVEIEEALRRIDDGTYGVDENTGAPIDPARLEAEPAARTNVEDASGQPIERR